MAAAGGRRWIAPLLSIALGLYLAVSTFTFSFLNGSDEAAVRPLGDRAQSLVGARYFVADQWRWPLLQVPALGTPDGTVIAFTDSIPIMALLAKLLRPFGAGPNYFGVWIIIVFVLQALGALSVLRALGVSRLASQLGGVCLAMLLPAFLFRSVHPALCAHGLVLFALSAALQLRGQLRWRPMIVASVVCVVSLLVHPYLFVMAGVITLGAWLDAWVARPSGRLLAWAGATGVALAAVVLAGGYLSAGGVGGGAEGFGVYSMDWASPIVPQMAGAIPGGEPILDQTGGQYEGYNYLGLGILLVVVLGVWFGAGLLRTGRGRTGLAGNRWLVVGVMLMALYAPSATWYVWGHGPYDVAAVVDRIPLRVVAFGLIVAALVGLAVLAPRSKQTMIVAAPFGLLALAGPFLLGPLTSQFRATGRFFWPAAYLLLFACVALIDRRVTSQGVLAAVMVGAVALQLVEVGPLRTLALGLVRSEAAVRYLDPESFETLSAAHSQITLWPDIACASVPVGTFSGLEVVTAASRSAIPVNSTYRARSAGANCEAGQLPDAVPVEKLQSGELRVYLDPDQELMAIIESGAVNAAGACRSNAPVVVCTTAWSALSPDQLVSFVPLSGD